MAIMDDVVIFANKALNRFDALAKQARSYTSHPTMLRAKGLASELSRGATGVRRNALIGAGVGAAAGAGYDYGTNPRSNARSMIRSGIRGGIGGAAIGAGYTYGRSAMGMASRRSITASSVMASARGKASSMMGDMRTAFNNRVAAAQAAKGY